MGDTETSAVEAFWCGSGLNLKRKQNKKRKNRLSYLKSESGPFLTSFRGGVHSPAAKNCASQAAPPPLSPLSTLAEFL